MLRSRLSTYNFILIVGFLKNTEATCNRLLNQICVNANSTSLRGTGFDLNYYLSGFQFVSVLFFINWQNLIDLSVLSPSSVTYQTYTLNSTSGNLIAGLSGNAASIAALPCTIGAVISSNMTVYFNATESAAIITGVNFEFVLQSVNSLHPTWNLAAATLSSIPVTQSFSVVYQKVSFLFIIVLEWSHLLLEKIRKSWIYYWCSGFIWCFDNLFWKTSRFYVQGLQVWSYVTSRYIFFHERSSRVPFST